MLALAPRLRSDDEQPYSPVIQTKTLIVAIGAFVAGTAGAQDLGAARTPVWRIGASARLLATDNVGAASTDPQSGVGAESTIDLHLNFPYRRLRGSVDLSLTGTAVKSDRSTGDHRAALLAGINAEIIESHFFLDLGASYGTQLLSVFGSPTQTLAVENSNRVQSGTVSASPVLRGGLGSAGRYEFRATDTTTKYRDTDNGDVHSQSGSMLVDSGIQPRAMTLKARAFGAINDFKVGRRTTEGMVRADIGWAFDSETVASVIAGREGNDFQTSRRVYSDIYGLSVEYRPNERTRIYAERVDRFFGAGHLVSISYRLPRFALLASSSRTSSTPGTELTDSTAFVQGSAFDVLFLQYASIEPDPDRRRILVQDLLVENGIDPSQQVVAKLAASGVLLVQRHSLSMSWSGVRDTSTVTLMKGSSSQFGSLLSLSVASDFQVADRVDQTGLRVDWIRRLTQSDNVSASLAWMRAVGAITQRSSNDRLFQMQWSRSVGTRSGIEVGLRHEQFESTEETAYRVNTLSFTYRIRF